MKTIVKTVYYCDFCKKRGLRKHSMQIHEEHCTANPDRTCRMCGNTDIKPLIEKYKNRFEIGDNGFLGSVVWHGEPVTQEMILDDTEGCPACALAIIRNSGLVEALKYGALEFDYAEATKKWWDAVNEEHHQSYY
jgi:hypothetical protein